MNLNSYVERRLKEYETLGRKGFVTFNLRPFVDMTVEATKKTELAFCISTANSSAISGLKFQKMLEGKELENLNLETIRNFMKSAGVRFYNNKALYLRQALDKWKVVEEALGERDDLVAREILVKNVKGFGYKEASHFLRNLGRKNVAIVDRHVTRWLVKQGYIKEPSNSLNKKTYLKLENILREIAQERKVSLAKLDLLIWYETTGKVLK